MQERMREIAGLITSLHGMRNTEFAQVLVSYLDLSLTSTRELCDNCTPGDLPKLQGVIATIKDLRSYILDGLPVRK